MARPPTTGFAPEGWPPQERTNSMPTPLGFFEVRDRETAQPITIRLGSVCAVVAMPNPKDGCKIIMQGNSFFNADQAKPEVDALMVAAYERIKAEDRGF